MSGRCQCTECRRLRRQGTVLGFAAGFIFAYAAPAIGMFAAAAFGWLE